MKRFVLVLFSWTLSLLLQAQRVQTIVPKDPVVIGTAFQVQYVITSPSDLAATSPPTFDSFRIVSGPNHYKGSTIVDGKQQSIENITYTLVPERLGTLTVKGITASFRNGPDLKSDDAAVSISPQPRASFSSRSSYTDFSLYMPSTKSDLQKIISQNLFIRTDVDKHTCYEGEPVVATFKLYSRLQSSSEALKSPSFYGFSVLDMLNINEPHAAVETIGGKVFNTSILRKVQLFPQQPGKLTIDQMYVQNEIEFDDSSTGITRKVLLEKELVSEPVVITVKSLPAKTPSNYSGAVGRFTLSAALKENQVEAGMQGKLLITVRGKGNFMQFGTPVITWPRSFEAFDPQVKDEIDKTTTPVEGTRTYEYDFVSDSTGNFLLPPVMFSYFDPAVDSFRTLHTDSITLHVVKKNIAGSLFHSNGKGNFFIWWVVIPLLSLMMLFFAIRYRNNTRSRKKLSPVAEPVREHKPAYAQMIQDLDVTNMSTQQACSEVEKILLAFSNENRSGLTAFQMKELDAIRNDCQLTMYAEMNEGISKEDIKARAIKVVMDV